MNKNTKKILALSVLGLFVLVFAMTVVSATSHNPIGDWFASWVGDEGQMSPNIAKYLFWALVSMAVYSIGANIPGLKTMFTEGKEWMGMLFSLIIGFLSMAYITPEEVYIMMTSYSALGFVLGGAMPFIILLSFTFTLATDPSGGAGEKLSRKILASIMWAAFVGFMVYKIVIGQSASAEIVASAGISALQWITLAVAIGMLIFLGGIFKRFGKMATKQELTELHENMQKQTAKLKEDVAFVERAAEKNTP